MEKILAGDTWKLMNKARAASSFTQTTTDRSPRQQEVGKEEDHNNGGYLAGSTIGSFDKTLKYCVW